MDEIFESTTHTELIKKSYNETTLRPINFAIISDTNSNTNKTKAQLCSS